MLKKAIKGTETSMFVGLAAAALAASARHAVRRAGRATTAAGSTTSSTGSTASSPSIPYLLLILAIAAVLNQKGTTTVILILGLTGWTGIFRLVRAEYLKHKVREYMQAADAIGASHARRMFVHILPNVSHVVLVQLSLHVVLFIKSEVVLSFLGFGVGVDTVSWGSMLNEAQSELILGNWWQLAAATDRHGAARHRIQPVHRRAARRARPQAQMTSRRSLLGIRDLRVDFRVDADDDAAGRQGHQLRHPGEQHGGAGRGIRKRQVGDRALAILGLLPQGKLDGASGEPIRVRGTAICSTLAPARTAEAARARRSR